MSERLYTRQEISDSAAAAARAVTSSRFRPASVKINSSGRIQRMLDGQARRSAPLTQRGSTLAFKTTGA